MVSLDRTEQRILGVLIEKQRTVPDIYPLSEHALVDGCNQKNNRDPLFELQPFEVAGALLALQQRGVVARVDGGGRVPRFRHKLDEVLPADADELALLCELLLRGPQAPGALKPRVLRLGYHAEPAAIEAKLLQMAARRPPLVEQLPLGPRERDRRFRHRLGPVAAAAEPAQPASPAAASPAAAAAAAPLAPAAPPDTAADLAARLAALEARVAALERRLGDG